MKQVYVTGIPLIVGLTAAFFTAQGVHGWYLHIQKPTFTPPNWLFGPVWTILYILMGVSLYMVWKQPRNIRHRKTCLFLFGIQLVLNLFWSFLFFVGHSPVLALVDIGLLWIMVVVMIIAFIQVREAAGLLQIPYVLWVSFAAVLNFAIWQLNA